MADYSKIARTLGENLDKKTVAIAGLGSVGSSLAATLARAGVKLRIVDMGRVEISDLSTISLFRPEEEAKFKAKEAKKHLESINPKVAVKSFHEQLNENNIFLLNSDLIIDCTQDWKLSLMINKFAKEKKIPLIFTKVAGAEGIVLACKGGFPHTKLEPIQEKLGNVKDKGLLPGTVNMATAIALSKAAKILIGEKFSDKLFNFDTWKLTKKESSL